MNQTRNTFEITALRRYLLPWLLLALICPLGAIAHEDKEGVLEEVVVKGRKLNLAGEARSASEGVIG